MQQLPFGSTAADFRWCVGIEDTFIPQTRPGMRALDEYELMGHYDRWRDDLRLARECGAQMIRWGIPWYRVEPQPGVFDWSWTDQVIPYMVEELGLEPILDLMHYGTPSWLDRSFVDPRYPEAVAAYARAVVERYGRYLRYYTPLNEPLVNADWCGRRGVWPPYLRGTRGYLAVAIALAKGIQATIAAIREADPRAVIVHVEATGLSRAAQPELAPLAAERQEREFLMLDLLSGRVNAQHPQWTWLLGNGVRPGDLRAIAASPVPIDVLGINFYPQWSTQEVSIDRQGALRWQPAEKDGRGFGDLMEMYHARYSVPIMVTETSALNDPAFKRHWLDASVTMIRDLRARGVPVIGYTWFPLFTMVAWHYRTGRGPVEDYMIELGLYESEVVDGQRRYQPTSLVPRFREFVAQPQPVVGDLAVPVGS